MIGPTWFEFKKKKVGEINNLAIYFVNILKGTNLELMKVF